MVAKQSKVRPRDQQYRIDGDDENGEVREDVQAFEIDQAGRFHFGAQRIVRDNEGKEECRASENDRARAQVESPQLLVMPADYQHDDKEVYEDHDRRDCPRNQRVQSLCAATGAKSGGGPTDTSDNQIAREASPETTSRPVLRCPAALGTPLRTLVVLRLVRVGGRLW